MVQKSQVNWLLCLVNVWLPTSSLGSFTALNCADLNRYWLTLPGLHSSRRHFLEASYLHLSLSALVPPGQEVDFATGEHCIAVIHQVTSVYLHCQVLLGAWRSHPAFLVVRLSNVSNFTPGGEVWWRGNDQEMTWRFITNSLDGFTWIREKSNVIVSTL